MPPGHETETAMYLRDSVPADLSGVSRALTAARDFAEKAVPRRVDRVRLAMIIEEVLLNVVIHGSPSARSRIELECGSRDGRIEIHIADAGIPFDPRYDVPVSSREDAVADEIEGGAGWPMILEWCDIEGYERADDQNRLWLSLSLSGSAGE